MKRTRNGEFRNKKLQWTRWKELSKKKYLLYPWISSRLSSNVSFLQTVLRASLKEGLGKEISLHQPGHPLQLLLEGRFLGFFWTLNQKLCKWGFWGMLVTKPEHWSITTLIRKKLPTLSTISQGVLDSPSGLKQTPCPEMH